MGSAAGKPTGSLKRFELRLRALAPRPLRTAYRLARGLATQHPISPWLPAELMHDCRFLASRNHLLDHLPAAGRVAEIGTWKGDFARQIMARSHPQELHLVDLDWTAFDDAGLSGHAVKRHTGASRAVIADFDDDSFDWIYIDADHAYAAVVADAAAAANKVRPGGFLVFNDFAHIDPLLGRYGVHRAVVEFAVSNGWSLRYVAYHPAGLYDAALQRPEAA